MNARFPLAAACAAVLLASPAARAADAHLRGTVTAVDGSKIMLKTRDGQDVTLTLGDAWKIGGVAKAGIDDIKPGTFIGTANVEGTSGSKALEVVVFPEALKGTGEGDYGWDLKPNSKMTNATVQSQVQGVDGQTLTLAYKGGEKKVTIGKDVPIVKIVMAGPDDVKPGAAVFVAGQPEGSTTPTGGRLVVGKNGVVPPM